MSGAVHFYMADIYGAGFSTTEETIPEAKDQNALVDDQKAAAEVADPTTNKKKFPILLAVALVLIIAAIAGGVK